MTMHLSPAAEAALARHAKAWRDGYDSGYADRSAEEIEQAPTPLVPTRMNRQEIDAEARRIVDEAGARPSDQSYALTSAQRLIEDLRTQARRDAELIERLHASAREFQAQAREGGLPEETYRLDIALTESRVEVDRLRARVRRDADLIEKLRTSAREFQTQAREGGLPDEPSRLDVALIEARAYIDQLEAEARRDAELIETLRSSRDAAINRLSEVAASAAEVYDDRPWSELGVLRIGSDGAPPSIGNGTVTAVRRLLPPAAPSDCPGFELRFKFEPGTLTRLGSGSRWIFSTPGFGPDNLANGDITDGAP